MVIIVIIIFRLGQSNLPWKNSPRIPKGTTRKKQAEWQPATFKRDQMLSTSVCKVLLWNPYFWNPRLTFDRCNIKIPTSKHQRKITHRSTKKTTYTNQPRRLSGPAVRRLSGLVVAWIRVKLKGSDSPNTSRELRVGGGGNLRNLQNERSDGVFGKRYLIFKYLETLLSF